MGAAFRMLFEGRGATFSILAQQLPAFLMAMNAQRETLKCKAVKSALAPGTQRTDFDLF